MYYVLVFVLGVLGGGFGGYQYGSYVQKKVAAELTALANSAKTAVSKL